MVVAMLIKALKLVSVSEILRRILTGVVLAYNPATAITGWPSCQMKEKGATMLLSFRYHLQTLVLLFVLLSPVAALAQNSSPLGKDGVWTAYRSGEGAGKVCFVTAEPVKLEGDYDRSNRGETRIFVTHGPDPELRGVVSVVAGYTYKEQQDVVFSIDRKKTFNLFSVKTRAWARNAEDAPLVKAMKRGNTLVVSGVSSRGNKTIDTYSLKGFTAAMKRIDKDCG